MKKLLFFFFCVFALESNLSAQRIDITNAGISSIESNREWVYVGNKMVYNPSVPFFTRTNPLAESYPLLYGMSIYTLYEASETDLVATIDLLKIDVQTLVLYLINNCIILNSCIYCVTLPYEKSQNSSK